jgi:hypothetical protein
MTNFKPKCVVNALHLDDKEHLMRGDDEAPHLESISEHDLPHEAAKAEAVSPLDRLDLLERENLLKCDKKPFSIPHNEPHKLPIIHLEDITPQHITSNPYGLPTCLSVSASFILIGTSSGILIQYDREGREIRCMRSGGSSKQSQLWILVQMSGWW